MLAALEGSVAESLLGTLSEGRPSLHAAVDLLADEDRGTAEVREVFELLLRSGADPNAKAGPLEETPLQAVLRQGGAEARMEVAKTLLDGRADPNATDNMGESPYFEAACNGDEEACRLLLAYGARPAEAEAEAAEPEEAEPVRVAPVPAAPAPEQAAEKPEEQAVVLNVKYVTAQGKEWSLQKMQRAAAKKRPATLKDGSDLSTNGDDSAGSAALSSSEDDSSDGEAKSAHGRVAVTKAITSYLVSDEEKAVNVYLKLEELFEGASEVFEERDFRMQATCEHLTVHAHGPGSRHGGDEVCWELSVPLPACVDAPSASLKLRKGKLSVKLPKAAELPRPMTLEEEARAEARALHPGAQPASKVPAKAEEKKAALKAAEQAREEEDARGVEEAVRCYGMHFGGVQEEEEEEERGPIFKRKAFPWRRADGANGQHWGPCARAYQATRAELERDLQRAAPAAQAGRFGAAPAPRDAEGEEVARCCQCRLPIGDYAYVAEGKEVAYMHGECIAQLRLRDLKKEDKIRLQQSAELKKKRRAKYDIGWKVERIPRSLDAASKLDCGFAPRGMCCLIYDEESHSISLAPTLDPAGSINPEYLSLALQVRFLEGREPTFSLDLPAEAPGSPDTWMQKKRFDPEWLAGTAVGEVMFQADYHLKELSMGEYEQPIVGMKSCFDYSEAEDHSQEWRAREWFVVRDAEVNLNESNVLIPNVKMGVQAREQIKGESGLEDVPITRPDHPLVRYAEAFTHNFDLIAERKSVIFHLRELAKATVLAKFLVDTDMSLDETWLDLAGQVADKGFAEIPQLWNERAYSQIRVQDGALVHAEKGDSRGRMFGVYGGVEFGVDRFQLSRPGRIAPPTASGMIVSKPGAVSFGMDRFRISRPKRAPVSVSAPVAPSVVSSVVSAVVPEAESRPPREFVPTHAPAMVRSSRPRSAPSVAVSRAVVSRPSAVRGVAPMPAQPLTAIVQSRLVQRAALVQRPGLFQRPGLQGVDLGLEKFNLSEATRVAGEDGSWSDLESVDPCVAIGNAFWKSIVSDNETFKAEDKNLLNGIFNPHLSDRREEGDQFVPPDKSAASLQALRELLAEEESVRKERTALFCSAAFSADVPGPLFPASWTVTIGISRSPVPEKARGLVLRPDYKAEAHMFDHVLKSAVPVFDRCAEDGLRFRVYRFGSLEVRTTQEHQGAEVIGAVFSRAQAQDAQGAEEHERVVKVTQYVESAPASRGAQRSGVPGCRYYVLLDTEEGNVIMTEKLADGTAAWEENPKDLEDRNSLAKVIRSVDCRAAGITVRDMRAYQAAEEGRVGSGKRYADGAYSQATGEAECEDFGFEQHYEKMH